jgi:hypothetical protein
MSDGCHWKRLKALRRVQEARDALAAEGICVARAMAGVPLSDDWPARVDVMLAEYEAASNALASISDCSD